MTDHTMKKNPASIPHSIWHADDIKRMEHEAADSLGLTLYELMQRAGEAAFGLLAMHILPLGTGWCSVATVITAATAMSWRDLPKPRGFTSRY